ncbi:anthocyanidin 3-O-glucosyltransferase 2-like [Nymphaea colorata]|uniref:anthocyanidin 3-O-glucosyltransferase 2-like n=1 Tax=Nymphaea colorata TaxID=210225 RepID=UPI00129D2F3E|nr:anthocyanidin 3-O-glucosyltransferase 2-like [Nymphaea colorata]
MKVVVFPAPFHGHLPPMIQLAKRLAVQCPGLSFTIIFMSTPLFSTANAAASIAADKASGVGIDSIDLPPVELANPEKIKPLTRLSLYTELHRPSLSDALRSLQASSTPISAFLIDFFCTNAIDVATSLGIPTYIFFTSSAVQLALMLHLPKLDLETKPEFRELTTKLEVPGMLPVDPRDLPVATLLDRKDDEYQWFLYHCKRLPEARGILVNSFRELEPTAFKALAEGECLPGGRTPAVHAVGPMIGNPGTTSGVGDPSHECLKWLDEHPDGSVVFLCFGSRGAFAAEQIMEIARGLELSGQRFLWSVLPPSHRRPGVSIHPTVDPFEALPTGFIERTKGRGLVWSGWTPQVAILSHRATGGFVSHCGWNSILESIWCGVPLIAWPLYAEQRMNKVEVVRDLGVGLGLEKEWGGTADGGLVRGEELERAVRTLMEREEGRKVREKMKEMKELGRRAMEDGGSSGTSLADIVHEWLSGSLIPSP